MGEKALLDWEDPRVFGLNKEPGHVLAMPYDDCGACIVKEPSPYKVSLNGLWKFSWVKNPSKRPMDFYKEGYSADA
jgi:beta-galactosidase